MSWEIYFEKNKGRPLRPLYLKAISLFNCQSLIAMDLGCGDGTEVADLLQKGFMVYAVDQEPQAIELVKAKVQNNIDKLHIYTSSFELLTTWPTVNFFYAFHSLPFCARTDFDQVVTKTIKIVSLGGLYVVSFFGPEDEWVMANKVSGISSETVKSKLKEFQLLHFQETKKIEKTVTNHDKMWHVIEVIAKRIEQPISH